MRSWPGRRLKGEARHQSYMTDGPRRGAGTYLARFGSCEVREGAAVEGVAIIQFPALEAAKGTSLPDMLNRLQASLADRYRIERELGHGGMATVFLAHDLKHDRPVALKVLRPDLAQVLGAERFLREIRLCGRLQHPHIVVAVSYTHLTLPTSDLV